MSSVKLTTTGGNGGTVELKGPVDTTSNAAVQLTLPVDDGSADQYLKTDGSGALSWATVSSGAALTGSTNNTICTVTGANAIQGEANLTFDGSALGVTGTITKGNGIIDIYDSNTDTTVTNGVTNGDIIFNAVVTSQGTVPVLRLGNGDATGNVHVPVGNLVIGTAGKGIDFSAQTPTAATNASTDAELLDHYEEGQWTPTINVGTLSTAIGNFTRVGRLVYLVGYIVCNSDVTGSSSYPTIGGFPFNSRGNPGTDANGIGFFGYNTVNTASDGPWTINFGKWATGFVTYRSQGSMNNADQYTSKVINFGIMYEAG